VLRPAAARCCALAGVAELAVLARGSACPAVLAIAVGADAQVTAHLLGGRTGDGARARHAELTGRTGRAARATVARIDLHVGARTAAQFFGALASRRVVDGGRAAAASAHRENAEATDRKTKVQEAAEKTHPHYPFQVKPPQRVILNNSSERKTSAPAG